MMMGLKGHFHAESELVVEVDQQVEELPHQRRHLQFLLAEAEDASAGMKVEEVQHGFDFD